MEQPEGAKKKGFLESLPRLGRLSQFILIIGVFLLIFIPLWMFYQQQPPKKAQLNATLNNLQKIVSVQGEPQAKFEAELAQARANREAAMNTYPKPNQAPEILDTLVAMAEENDIYVISTAVSSSAPAGAIGPALNFRLGLRGQIPKFQNFLLELGNKLPTSQIQSVSFTVRPAGQEYDTATITISVFCYGGS